MPFAIRRALRLQVLLAAVRAVERHRAARRTSHRSFPSEYRTIERTDDSQVGTMDESEPNRGRACRGCAGRLPDCRACEPRTDSAARRWLESPPFGVVEDVKTAPLRSPAESTRRTTHCRGARPGSAAGRAPR